MHSTYHIEEWQWKLNTHIKQTPGTTINKNKKHTHITIQEYENNIPGHNLEHIYETFLNTHLRRTLNTTKKCDGHSLKF